MSSKISLNGIMSRGKINSQSAVSHYIPNTKSEIPSERQVQVSKQYVEWYSNLCKHKYSCGIPSSITQNVQSIPYRLVINKILGISIGKKPQRQDLITIKVTGNLFTKDADPIGQTISYICEQPLFDTYTKHSSPIIFYYHTRIDKSLDQIYLVLSFSLLEIKNQITISNTLLGIALINPLKQCDNKTVQLVKNISEIDLIKDMVDASKTSVNINFTISSLLEIKPIIKFINSDLLVSSQDHITGIQEGYLPQYASIKPILECSSVEMNIKSLQIHIPQRFEQQAILVLSKIPKFGPNPVITSRKIICGMHNQYKIISPSIRPMEFIEKQGLGELKVNVYEVNSEREIIKIPYYISQNNNKSSLFVIGLIFEVSGEDIEIAWYGFAAKVTGQKDEISESMITKAGMGVRQRLLGINYSKKPTLIMQYDCESILNEISQEANSTYINSRKRTSIMDKRVIKDQIEKQRLALEKEKQELERLRTQHYIKNNEDLQKKFEQERENIYKKQQRLEQYYRQEMEKQIAHKINLEKEIALLKEKMENVDYVNTQSKKPSYEPSEKSQHQAEGLRIPIEPSYQNVIRHYVNNAHLIEPQSTIPVTKLRSILQTQLPQNLKIDYEGYNNASTFTITLSSIKWINVDPPNKMYFEIMFFNFGEFKTEQITYSDLFEEVKTSNQFAKLKKFRVDHDELPSYTFKVDPSTHQSPQLYHRDLIDYLATNCIIIDIFDSQSQLYLGQVNVKLKELLRANKKQVLIAKECPIRKIMDSQQNNGVLQLLMRNEQSQCKQLIQNKKVTNNNQTHQVMKRKIVSNAPLRIPTDYRPEIASEAQQKVSRQQQRIKNFKNKQRIQQSSLHSFNDVSDSQKPILFQTITAYKQKNIENYLKDVYSCYLSSSVQLVTYLGKTETFSHEFTNNSSIAGCFRVSIDGGTDKSLNLVNDSAEWKYFTKKYKYSPPKNYQIINQHWTFYLNASQTIPLLFKYLSFSKKPSASFNVTIVKEDTMMMVDGFTTTIQHHQAITHHSYILYEPGSQIVDIILPVLYSPTADHQQERIPYLTIENIRAQFLNEFEILLRLKSPQIMKYMSFNLLLYSDNYFDCLLENWKIKVYSYEGIYTMSRPEGPTKFKLSLPEQIINHNINLFSNSPFLRVSVQNSTKDYWCQIDYFDNLQKQETGIRKIEVTCIDSMVKRLIYGWIITVLPYSLRNM